MDHFNELFTHPITQFVTWMVAALCAFQARHLLPGDRRAWNIAILGFFLYGCRVGYKLLPFAKATPALEATRYLIGIVALILIFVGLIIVSRDLYRSA